MSQQFSFAFKTVSPDSFSNGFFSLEEPDTKERRAFQALIAETLILTHPSIQNHPNITNLEGIRWGEPTVEGKVWSVLMFEKAQSGDLDEFILSDVGKTLNLQELLKLCKEISRAIAAMHSGST